MQYPPPPLNPCVLMCFIPAVRPIDPHLCTLPCDLFVHRSVFRVEVSSVRFQGLGLDTIQVVRGRETLTVEGKMRTQLPKQQTQQSGKCHERWTRVGGKRGGGEQRTRRCRPPWSRPPRGTSRRRTLCRKCTSRRLRSRCFRRRSMRCCRGCNRGISSAAGCARTVRENSLMTSGGGLRPHSHPRSHHIVRCRSALEAGTGQARGRRGA